jgi:hypothetical protein
MGKEERVRLADVTRAGPLAARFWAKVKKTGACWLWLGSVNETGYGRVGVCLQGGWRITYAHRVAYLLTRGEIPDNLCACHHCDNPPCVNPEHIFLGTRQDNNADAIRKGRLLSGEAHPLHRLTHAEVQEMRSLHSRGETHRALGLRFGVSHTTVWSIAHFHHWRAVPPPLAVPLPMTNCRPENAGVPDRQP